MSPDLELHSKRMGARCKTAQAPAAHAAILLQLVPWAPPSSSWPATKAKDARCFAVQAFAGELSTSCPALSLLDTALIGVFAARVTVAHGSGGGGDGVWEEEGSALGVRVEGMRGLGEAGVGSEERGAREETRVAMEPGGEEKGNEREGEGLLVMTNGSVAFGCMEEG
eukprot:3635918-Rhodomonas_salina.2